MIISALLISLKMSIVSIIASSIVGIGLARLFFRRRGSLKSLVDNLLLVPVFLPPSIVGYALLVVLGRNGVIGRLFYELFNAGIIFTWQAGAIATFIMSVPIVYQNSKATFISIDHNCEEAAKVDGANKLQIFTLITLPMSMKGLLTGIILGFARAFGEFGATLMVAGNIPGSTQSLPTAMYYAVEGGDRLLANQIFAAVLGVSFLLIVLFNHISHRNEY